MDMAGQVVDMENCICRYGNVLCGYRGVYLYDCGCRYVRIIRAHGYGKSRFSGIEILCCY